MSKRKKHSEKAWAVLMRGNTQWCFRRYPTFFPGSIQVRLLQTKPEALKYCFGNDRPVRVTITED